MIAALLVSAQLAASPMDCTPLPVPLPKAAVVHGRHKHRAKPHVHPGRKSYVRKHKPQPRAPMPALECTVHPAAPVFTQDIPPLDDVQPVDDATAQADDVPLPFTPTEAQPEGYSGPPWSPAADVPGGGVIAPPRPPVHVPEPGPLGLMALAFVALLALIVDGRRDG